MNERKVVWTAVILTVILSVFTIGFAAGRRPEREGVVLISSVSEMDTMSSADPSADQFAAQSTSESKAVSEPEENTSEQIPDTVQFPINLNTATAEELIAVPGIGEVTAGRSLEYRAQIGRFESVDELLEVKGIGEKKLASMREYLSV